MSEPERYFDVESERLKPIYKHDCEACVYLATVHTEGRAVDWYIHQREGRDEMIGRYGNEPSQNVTPYWQKPFTPLHLKGNRFALWGDSVIAAFLREKFLSSAPPSTSNQE